MQLDVGKSLRYWDERSWDIVGICTAGLNVDLNMATLEIDEDIIELKSRTSK